MQVGYQKFEDKLRELELGLNKHKYEVGEMRKHIDTIEQKEKKSARSIERPNDIGEDVKVDAVVKPMKGPRAMKSSFESTESSKCSFRVDIDPKPDIQVTRTLFCRTQVRLFPVLINAV